MAATSLPWLPRNAIAAAAEKVPLRDAVSDWSAKWIAHLGTSFIGMEAIAADFQPDGAAMQADDGLIVVAGEGAAAAVGTLMFGDPGSQATSADAAAIGRAADRALADLRVRVAQALGLPRDTTWRPHDGGAWPAGYRYRVKLGVARFDVVVADRLLIAGIRSRLRPDPVRAPLGAIATGLAPHPVALSALLGESRLSMRDLAALAEGDVVVLDRGLTDSATLVVDRMRQSARCRIAAGDIHLDLTLA